MKTRYIFLRHGQRLIAQNQMDGLDGPLTTTGRQQIHASSLQIADTLKPGVTYIDRAFVSGSARCTESFALFWSVMVHEGISIRSHVISQDFFATNDETVGWKKFWKKLRRAFELEKARNGDGAAYIKYASHLINPCVKRTAAAVRAAGEGTFLIVTHGPHESLIAEELTGILPQTFLELGEFRIFTED